MISVIVPSQNFEIVRDAIATILLNEISNQAILMNVATPNSGDYLGSCIVDVERDKPIDKVEVPFVNVSLLQNDFSNKHQGSRNGTVQFGIDIYTSAKTNNVNAGDKIAAIRLQKMLGLVTYILEDPIYNSLLLPKGFIGRTWTSGFQIRSVGENDASNQAMARLIFNVLCSESNALQSAPLVAGSQTTMIIDNTTNGYFVNNTY